MIAILIAIGTIIFYYFIVKPAKYWREINVPTGTIVPIFGEHFLNILGRDCSSEFSERIYNKVPGGRYCGIYLFQKPVLVLKSPDLIKDICVKNFNNVLNRQALSPDCSELLMSRNLLALKGQLWKDIRHLLSPSFTISKLKASHFLLCDNALKTVKYFLGSKEELVEVEVKDAFTRFTNDAIANTIFGLEVNSFTIQENDFFMMGKDVTNYAHPWKIFAVLMYNLSSKLARNLKINIYGRNTTDFYTNIVGETIKLREEKNIQRPDVLGTIIEARKRRNKNNNESENLEKESQSNGQKTKDLFEKYLTDEDIAAHLFLFKLGGYDTSSTTMCFMAYELAINPEIQKKLIEEIDKVRPEEGLPPYETIMNMEYMDMVVSETLRKWPSISHTDRIVTHPFTIEQELPEEKPIHMKEGDKLIIPIFGIHRDPKFYENPDLFDPDRFSSENKKKIKPYTYLPFGVGPRNCIGMRLALLKMLLIGAVLCILLYFLVIKPHFYWKNRNVPSRMFVPILGESLPSLLGRENMADSLKRMYNKISDVRYLGIFQLMQPILIVKSPELIKMICIKDFDHFLNHKMLIPDKVEELLSRNLLTLKGQNWKNMRVTLSPCFTTSKIKSMFTLITQNAEKFAEYFVAKDETIVEVEFKDAFTRYTNDVIANTAFGLQVDSLKDRENDFYMLGREITNFSSFRKKFAFFFSHLFPTMAKFLGVELIGKKTTNFFLDIIRDTIKMREEQNIRRPDMIGLLLDARKGLKKEKTVTDGKEAGFAVVNEHLEAKEINQDLTDLDIASQMFIFFLGGFDTVSTAMCFMAHELAADPDVQARLIEEVDENIRMHGTPTYESIANMIYMDMVVCETLRKWPVNIATDREVTKPYTIKPELPGEEPVHLEVGEVALIPIMAIHYDPKYYENPEKFDPERFSPENRKNINPYAYIPFGVGPRNCIGSRFAILEMKAVFFHILACFEIVPVAKTNIPIKLSRTDLTLTSENGQYYLGLKKRDT